MISQIGHLVKVSLRVGIVTAWMYTLGLLVGAGVLGGALGTLGFTVRWLLGARPDLYGAEVLLPVAVLAALGGLRDLDLIRLNLPQPYRQVPRGWLRVFGPQRTGFLWGLAVGLGYTTLIQFSIYYVIALWSLLSGSPVFGAAVLGTYALAQGVLLVVETAAVAAGPEDRPSAGGLFGVERSRALFVTGGVSLLGFAALAATYLWSGGAPR